jgi:hypothetical protein
VNSPRKIWFPAKRYGWGWGLPIAWQGWVVLAVFVASITAGVVFVLPSRGLFIGYVIVLILAFTAVCWAKGERPGWRWGSR